MKTQKRTKIVKTKIRNKKTNDFILLNIVNNTIIYNTNH